jgi:hypothetical protein
MKQRMYVLATLIVVSTLLISGCTSSSISGTKIKDIVDNPGKYSGTEVTVSGKVTEEERIMGYIINDGTASIMVESDTIPAVGEEVSVKGIVGVSISGVVYIKPTVKK